VSGFPAGSVEQMPGMANNTCGKCGAEIFAEMDSCAACLLETGLDSPGHSDSEKSRLRPARTDFGDYELLEEIGRGGQGVVYRARQKSLNRVVALKVIALGHWATEAHLRRFRLEAETVASLDQPGIVPIYEVGEQDGQCYFTMKFIEGDRLDRIVRNGSMSILRAGHILAELARTVQYAHERGVLHRDIKPGNVLIDANGKAHLTDFGLAKLIEKESTITNTHDVLGTPSYMAPEQITGAKELTSAMDVWGLGAVLFEMITGRAPFLASAKYELIRQVLESEPPRPRSLNRKVDVDLETICLKCLEKEPARRYSSALALAEDLECWLRKEPVQARRSGMLMRGRKLIQRNLTTAALVASLGVVAIAFGLTIWKTQPVKLANGIAVLPFENLSDANESASLTDGMQDDILTKLAKIADLKVISRTSVMRYRGDQDIREIGQTLNVSHVLQGSVRKAGTKIHVNVQLIDVLSDSHVWAEQYDRNAGDVFAIQSEVALKVAEQLHVKMSPAEKRSIRRAPTTDLTAFDLHARAKNLFLTASFSNSGKEDLLEAADLLNQAVARDPSFFQAYCQLTWTHDLLYNLGHDHTPARLALAEAAIRAAFRLQPDEGEAHLARADNFYRGYLDYESAVAELELARVSLPNDSRIFELKGYVEYRQGKYEEAVHDLEHAAGLDPRNIFTLQQITTGYILLQRYAEAKSAFARALLIEPDDVLTKVASAWVEFEWKADTSPLHHTIDSIRATNSAEMPHIVDGWLICALAERDVAAAKDALIVAGQNTPFNDEAVHFNRHFVEGIIARLENNEGKAHAAFIAARAEQEKIIDAQPDYAPPLCVLGLIDAALGRKEKALGEARRAVELLPVEKDAMNGPLMTKYSAMIAAWVGEKDLACQQLATTIHDRGFVSYGQLKLYPFWDPLRGDPRFEKIVSSLAPK
jgi:serine/threonine protein kinase/tetratricopeptide (TPR) repeat protein